MKLLNRIVNLPLWRPAASLMQRHRFPVKMALISATFMVPLLWLLGVYASNQQAQMAFAHQEREGVRYVQTVYGALEAAVQWQTGQSDGQQRLSTALSAVKALDAELGTAFKTSASMAQLQQAGDAAATTQALVALLDHVADQSGLALDPDMASYHLMSAVLMRAPPSHTAHRGVVCTGHPSVCTPATAHTNVDRTAQPSGRGAA